MPEDPSALEDAIRPYRLMMRPVLAGISKTCTFMGSEPLDKDEKESGEIAFGSVMYQAGGTLNAWVLVFLWVVGVAMPRALVIMDKRLEEKKARLRGERPGPAWDMGNLQRVEAQATGAT